MNHCHFQCRDFFGTHFRFPYIRREIVIYIKVVEHLFIDSVDTSYPLDDPCRVIGDIIIEYRPCPMQVVAFGYGIGGNQYLIGVLLQLCL